MCQQGRGGPSVGYANVPVTERSGFEAPLGSALNGTSERLGFGDINVRLPRYPP